MRTTTTTSHTRDALVCWPQPTRKRHRTSPIVQLPSRRCTWTTQVREYSHDEPITICFFSAATAPSTKLAFASSVNIDNVNNVIKWSVDPRDASVLYTLTLYNNSKALEKLLQVHTLRNFVDLHEIGLGTTVSECCL